MCDLQPALATATHALHPPPVRPERFHSLVETCRCAHEKRDVINAAQMNNESALKHDNAGGGSVLRECDRNVTGEEFEVEADG